MYSERLNSGKYHFYASEREILEDHDSGFCTACGEEAYGVEPDAHGYECEVCGVQAVHGLQELLIMGRVEITISFND